MAINDNVPNRAANVTPLDTTEIVFHRLVVGGAGTVIVVTEGGDTVTYTCVAGQKIEVRGHIVKTASTATNIVREWFGY